MLFYNKKIFKRCFCYRPKYWYLNLKEIPLYFKLIHHLVKYGYDEYATWETYDWFIYTMKDILSNFRANHSGYPTSSFNNKQNWQKECEEYDADFDKMISLLDDMNEDNPKYRDEKYNSVGLRYEEMEDAKDKFFKLFSKHFYTMWD